MIGWDAGVYDHFDSRVLLGSLSGGTDNLLVGSSQLTPPVKRLLQGADPDTVASPEALSNPSSLDFYRPDLLDARFTARRST